MDLEIDDALDLPVNQVAQALLAYPEGQWFERKSGRIRAKDLAVAEIAMANAEGGRIAAGLYDGRVEGVSDEQRNALRQASMDFTRPPVRARADEVPVLLEDGTQGYLLLISVEPGEGVHELTNGDCFLRVGDESRKLTFAQRQELHFDRGQPPYDGTPVAGVDAASVLRGTEASSWAAALGARDASSLMRARGLLRGNELTVASYLLFADHPQDLFPHAHVRVLRFEEDDPGSGKRFTLDEDADVRCEGPVPAVIDYAAATIERLLPQRRSLGSAGRFEGHPILPRDAWLEGLVNAVVHRSYSNAGDSIRIEIYPSRVVIESPGRFPGIVDPSRPDLITRYARNPRIARVCTDLRLAQELGEGIRRIFDEMRLSGLADPVYQQTASSVRLTLSAVDAIPEEVRRALPRGATQTLAALRRAGRPLGTAEVVELVGVSRPTVLRQLNSLVEHGLLVWDGKSPKDPRAAWRVDG